MPPHGGDTKISKRRFGFKGGRKIFWTGANRSCSRASGVAAETGRPLPSSKACRQIRDGNANALLDNARHPLQLRCLWRSLAIPETGWNRRRPRALLLSSRPISFIRFWLFFSVICKL
jgi:hypothetical protein